MTLKEIYSALAKIGSLCITTLDGETMYSRIISICGGDDEGIYFKLIKAYHRVYSVLRYVTKIDEFSFGPRLEFRF